MTNGRKGVNESDPSLKCSFLRQNWVKAAHASRGSGRGRGVPGSSPRIRMDLPGFILSPGQEPGSGKGEVPHPPSDPLLCFQRSHLLHQSQTQTPPPELLNTRASKRLHFAPSTRGPPSFLPPAGRLVNYSTAGLQLMSFLLCRLLSPLGGSVSTPVASFRL